jgi:hypothetical protein
MSELKIVEDKIVIVAPLVSLEPKINSASGKINKNVRWTALFKHIYPIHPGQMKINKIYESHQKLVRLDLQHIGDCDVKFNVQLELDFVNGWVHITLPLSTENNCSKSCIEGR